jgi:Domain of unknown function (DUF4386)
MNLMERNLARDSGTAEARWTGLCKVGGVAALIAALIFRRWLGPEFLGLRAIGIIHFGPKTMPASVADWFALLQTSRLLGLTLLNAFDIVNYALVGLIFLALYAALRQANRSAMTLAVAVAFVGIAVYFASNQAFSMLSLSNQYAAATTDAQRSALTAAGQALLAINNPAALGPGALSFLLVTVAGLITSLVMLQSGIFGKATAYVGVVANVFGLGYPIGLVFAPRMVAIPLSASAPFLLIWYLLIARKLMQLGFSDHRTQPKVEL